LRDRKGRFAPVPASPELPVAGRARVLHQGANSVRRPYHTPRRAGHALALSARRTDWSCRHHRYGYRFSWLDSHRCRPACVGLPFVRVNRTTGTMHDKHIVTNSNFTGVVMDESPVKQHRVMLRQVQEHLLAAHLLLGSLLESAGMVDVVHHPASPLPDLNYV